MSIPFPNAAPEAWNVVKLGKDTLPGIATVSLKAEEEVETKKPKGKAGATTTIQGPSPASLVIRLTMLRQSELDEWARIVKVLRPTKDSTAPVSIEHPKAALYGISSVVVFSIADDENKVGDIVEVTISCVEFRPPPKAKKATATPKTLDPHHNALAGGVGSGQDGSYIQVERPKRDPKNKGPKPDDGVTRANVFQIGKK